MALKTAVVGGGTGFWKQDGRIWAVFLIERNPALGMFCVFDQLNLVLSMPDGVMAARMVLTHLV